MHEFYDSKLACVADMLSLAATGMYRNLFFEGLPNADKLLKRLWSARRLPNSDPTLLAHIEKMRDIARAHSENEDSDEQAGVDEVARELSKCVHEYGGARAIREDSLIIFVHILHILSPNETAFSLVCCLWDVPEDVVCLFVDEKTSCNPQSE